MNDTEIDNLIRDICKAGFMPKSEARRRISELLHQRDEKWRKAADAISEYAQHTYNCIRSSFEAGEATKTGYRQKFKGKWYESRPIDKTPKCDCGLDDVINLMKD